MPTAYIALGSNLPSPAGSPQQTLQTALRQLHNLGQLLATSTLYRTQPVGYDNQPDFLNAVAALRTTLSPIALLDALLDIEQSLGRDRSQGIQNGPRTLDLDLLLYDDCILSTHSLQLPHPRMAQRAFVLIPMQEIAPHVIHPQRHKSMTQLCKDLHYSMQDSTHAPRQPIAVQPLSDSVPDSDADSPSSLGPHSSPVG